MATKIQCDRCGIETESKSDIGSLLFEKKQTAFPKKAFDLCTNCQAVIQQVISDECANFKNRTEDETA